MANTCAPCVVMPNIRCPAAPETEVSLCLYNIVTPYNLTAWGIALCEAGLLYTFLNLIFDLTYGAPIGNPPPRIHTFSPNNLRSAELDPLYMDEFLASKVAMGQIDGPFTVTQAHVVFGGHFRTAPLGKEDPFGQSTNGWVNSSLNATKYYSVTDAVDFVSSFIYISQLLPIYHLSLFYNLRIL